MKKLLLLFFIIAIIFSGCDKDGSPAGPEDNLTFTYLKGRIEDWNPGSGKSMAFIVCQTALSQTEIKADGSFLIQCPNPPDALLAKTVDCFFSPCISISDSSSKFNYAVLCILSGGKEVGEAVQSDRRTNDPYYLEDVGSYMTEYWYFDKPVSITGFSETMEGFKSVRYNYNIKALSGWNIITKSLSQNFAESKVYRMDSGLSGASHYYYVSSSYINKRSPFSPSVLFKKQPYL